MDDKVTQVAGNAGGEPEPGTAKGEPVLRFSVAVTKSYKSKLTAWVQITVMNSGLMEFAKANIHKGTPVVAEGYLNEGQYNGKPQFSMIAYRLGVVDYGTSTKRAEATENSPAVQGW